MKPRGPASRRRVVNALLAAAVLVLLVIVVWLDITSTMWQEMVILSGIAAGLLTFLLTALFVERWMATREHQKWFPVTRLAVSDILHSLADDNKSDIRRGRIVPRTLECPDQPTEQQLDDLLHSIVEERDRVTGSLARWSNFLASSADVQTLMIHVAALAETLDDARDAVVEAEGTDPANATDVLAIRRELDSFNCAAEAVAQEIQSLYGRLKQAED